MPSGSTRSKRLRVLGGGAPDALDGLCCQQRVCSVEVGFGGSELGVGNAAQSFGTTKMNFTNTGQKGARGS